MNLKKEITLADLGKAFSRKPKEGGSTPKARARKQAKTPKELVGLEIGASKLAAAYIVNNGTPELRQIASDPIDSGFVVNGEVRDVDGLAAALSEFFGRHSLPRKGVRLGVANSRIGVRPFEIAGVSDERQLENAIRFRAQELVPIPLEEAVIDHQVLDKRTDDAGNTIWRVLLVVAHRGLIDGYVDACRKAGLELAGIDLEAFGLLRALAEPRAGDEPSALVAVSIGHERTTLAVSDGTVCEFTRVLEWGGASLNAAIAKVLEITPREADSIKRTLVLGGGTVAGLPDDKEQAVLGAVRRELQTFARELVSSLQFYQGQPSSLSISEVVITGGTATMAGLEEELQKLIRVDVRVGDPTRRVRVAKSVGQPESLGGATVAIGLAIEDPHMRAVNLLSNVASAAPARSLRVPKASPAIAAGVLGAAVCGLVAMSFVNARSDVGGLNDQLDSVRAQDAALVAEQPKGDPLVLADRQQRETALATALGYRVAWENLLGDVGYVLPANVLLTALHVETPTSPVSGAAAPAGTAVETGAVSTFSVAGIAPTQRAVAQALRRLAVVPGLTGVTLQSSISSGTEIVFTIAATVRTKEGIRP